MAELKRSFFQRLFGKCATNPPTDPHCWSFKDGLVVINLALAPELQNKNGAIRLEGEELPLRVLVMRDFEGKFRAFENKCRHAGRRLDPIPDVGSIQCCSIGKATYDHTGQPLDEKIKEPVKVFPVDIDGDKLFINID